MTLHFPEHSTPEILSLEARGEYSEASARLQARLARAGSESERTALEAMIERLRRLQREFPLSTQEAAEEVNRLAPGAGATPEEIDRWRGEGWIQARQIDGVWRHFRRGPSNLLRDCPALKARLGPRPPAPPPPGMQVFDAEEHLRTVVRASKESETGLCCPTRQRLTIQVTVEPGVVPEGEVIRCWLAAPREEPQQTDITLVSCFPASHVLAPADTPQRTIHFEQPSRENAPTEFSVVWEYTSWASHLEMDPARVRPHDPASTLMREFTREEPPHIVFTPEIRRLAAEIVEDETNPLLRARRIFDWIGAHIRWIGELDYSVIENIPSLCLARRAGDCGVQALTFIALCRCAGVPARWESGLWTEPSTLNMHDWARFHVEPYGWRWADLTKGGHPHFKSGLAREFYFGGIDAFRLVINSATAQPLIPAKRSFRSDTTDFQRGELEWRGGNVGCENWRWSAEVRIVGQSCRSLSPKDS